MKDEQTQLPRENIRKILKSIKYEKNYYNEKTVKIGKARQHLIRLPKEVVEHFNIKKGNQVKIKWKKK